MRTLSQKSVVALALVAPLALTACGSKDEKDTTAATTTVTSTSAVATTTTTEASTSAESATEANTDTAAPAEPKADNANGAAAPAPAPGEAATMNSLAQNNALPTETLEPVADGKPADNATSEEINRLLNGWYDANDTRAFLRYVPDHTCSAVRDQNPEINQVDYNSVPALPMSQMNPNWNAAGVESVKDIEVNGDEASATVTLNSGDSVDTSVMRFRHEGGRWTFCN